MANNHLCYEPLQKVYAMIIELPYTLKGLRFGKCTCCKKASDEILETDGRCLSCIDIQNFEVLCTKKSINNSTDDEQEITFEQCDECDQPDACEDFGCAIKQGLKQNTIHP